MILVINIFCMYLLHRFYKMYRESGVEWSGVEWSGVEWSGVEWSGVEWSGVEWSGVEWSGVEWSGVGVSLFKWNSFFFLSSCKVYVLY
jgi:hypothetical protein